MTSSEVLSQIARYDSSSLDLHELKVLKSSLQQKKIDTKIVLITCNCSRDAPLTQTWFVVLSSEFVRRNRPNDAFLYFSSVFERPVFGLK